MSDRLNLRTGDRLHSLIGSTLTAIHSRASDLTAEAVVAEIEADVRELQLEAVAATLSACYGPDMGTAVFNDLTGRLDLSDAELARRYGLTRQAVSKTLRRVRKNLGLPVRMPSKSRAGWRAKKGPRAL